jgi:hypothetical protein
MSAARSVSCVLFKSICDYSGWPDILLTEVEG